MSMSPLKIATRIGLALSMSFNVAALQAQTTPVTPPKAKTEATRTVQTKPPGQKKPGRKHGTKTGVKTGANSAAAAPKPTMTLKFYNLHTGESLTLRRHKGEPLTPAAQEFMRDYRADKTVAMDPKLFDLLGRLQQSIVAQHPKLSVTFQVVSSYRTPQTNETLREAGGTQARYSQHMRGKAMDIRVPGVSTTELRDLATCLNGGGVGFYAEDQFVHVDTGRPRYWPSHDYLATVGCKTPPQPHQQRDVVATRKPRSGPRKG